MVDGGGHWLVRMEWRPVGWSVCLPLLIFLCTIESRSSLLAPAHPGGPGKRAVNGCGGWYCAPCVKYNIFCQNDDASTPSRISIFKIQSIVT